MENPEITKLEQTILALEAQRSILGDSVVDTAIGPLREKLQALRSASGDSPQMAVAETQQRKIVTILFADIPGLAALAEILDAEDLRDAANALWEQLDAVILEYGGRIDKHMGYGVMALWGADVVGEDDPERAILAALGLRSTLEAFVSISPLFSAYSISDDLQIRVGVNSGPAIVGLVGTTGEFTAIGDTINLGARLNQAAKPGEILISNDIYRLVRGVFDVTVQPPLQVKGKSEPVQTYLVWGEKPRVFHIQVRGVEGIETLLIGREAELAAIRDAYQRLFTERQPRLVTIVGDMGLGKSRLLQEFIAWADPLPEDWYLFQGRSTPSQMGAPYSLLRDIFSFRFEIQDNDSLFTVFDKMEHGFAALMPDDEHSKENAHIVGELIGFDFSSSPYLRGLLQDPKQLRNLGFAIMARFFANAARQFPVILMLDDIHWADNGSLDGLKYLVENLPAGTPFLILATARPSLFERFPGWGTGLPFAVKLELKPLTRDDSRALVGQILQKAKFIPATLQEMIVDGADGNPFYLEELIKMLVDGKVIRAEGETWDIDLDRLDTVSIPSTLAGVLQARLDRLDSLERASLQRASVVGRVFWDRAVESLGFDSPVERRQLEESLSVLRSKELIFASPVSTFTGTQEYSFKHALLRDVTYETVLKRQRAVFHERVADWLSKASGERRGEYLPVIAEHYEKAGDHEKAVDVLIEAGERALGVSAFGEAFRLFQRALSLLSLQDTRQQSYVYLKIGEAFFRSGEYADSLKNSEKALSLAREISVGNLLASALYQIGQLHAEMGNYQLAEQYLTQALALVRASGERADAILARVLFGLGNIYWRMGDLSKAHSFCAESRDLAARLDDTHTLMLALNRLGVVTGLMGDSAEEERIYLQVLSLARLVGNRERAAVALNNLGALADEQHDPAKAQGFYLQALSLAREMGIQQSLALYLINLGHCEIGLGKLDAADEHLREGLALADHHGAAPWTVIAVLFFALLAHVRGDDERAFTLFGLARQQAAFSSDHQRLMDQALAEWGVSETEAAQRMAASKDLDWKQVVLELLS
jgi:class 3 adenylate cyclase/tetratricopeptide (TPR) repeat protein